VVGAVVQGGRLLRSWPGSTGMGIRTAPAAAVRGRVDRPGGADTLDLDRIRPAHRFERRGHPSLRTEKSPAISNPAATRRLTSISGTPA